VTVAAIRPDAWNLPLFLHVLGAIILAGAVAAAALAARASTTAAIPRQLAFRTLALVALPAWVLMRVAGQWIESKEDVPGDPTWLGIGFSVADIGLPVLVVTTAIAWWAGRRPQLRWAAWTTSALAFLYLLALGVAWWAMSAKPGA
jgi:cytochrome bd-type quinol oxidase subunit 2